MAMSDRVKRMLLFCADQELKARRGDKLPPKPPPQPWNTEVIRVLELELAVSPTRHECDCSSGELSYDDDSDRIGSPEVCAMTGWNIRKVQRNADELGATNLRGRLVFSRKCVAQYLEGGLT